MKRFLITLLLVLVSAPVFANTTLNSAMKLAGDALIKKDYVTAEKYYGVAAREFNKIKTGKSPAETLRATSLTAATFNASELKALMPDVKQFSNDIQKVYYSSKDTVTKDFLFMLIMAEDGAKLLVDQPGMLELTNQILENGDMKNIISNPVSNKARKEQEDFLKGMYGIKIQDGK